MSTRNLNRTLIVALLTLAAGPGLGMGLAERGPSAQLPVDGTVPVAIPIIESLTAAESLAAGAGALVPHVATELPATSDQITGEAPLPGAAALGKPVDDIVFLTRASEGARLEAQAARDALPRLQDPELKLLAEALISDLGDANATLERLARARTWPLPAIRLQDAPPTGTAAPDFDAQWTAERISAHEKAMALYGAQARAGEDKELRHFARDLLPTMEHHLAELRRLQK